MKKIPFLIFFVLYGCFSNQTTFDERILYEQLKKKPLTNKENAYSKLLKSKGYFNIIIFPPTIGIEA